MRTVADYEQLIDQTMIDFIKNNEAMFTDGIGVSLSKIRDVTSFGDFNSTCALPEHYMSILMCHAILSIVQDYKPSAFRSVTPSSIFTNTNKALTDVESHHQAILRATTKTLEQLMTNAPADLLIDNLGHLIAQAPGRNNITPDYFRRFDAIQNRFSDLFAANLGKTQEAAMLIRESHLPAAGHNI